jgi:hypothetical protein
MRAFFKFRGGSFYFEQMGGEIHRFWGRGNKGLYGGDGYGDYG